MAQIIGQKELKDSVKRILNIFKASEGAIRPHFILTGPSGTGKSMTIETLAKKAQMGFITINAAQLTKEGTSGNSLSKALSPMLNYAGRQVVVFVDEWDKLYLSGNSNNSLAHETTTGVQNEFLKVLEAPTSEVFGDYGKYIAADMSKCLFIFAGAFNNEEEMSLNKLSQLGVKTEFLGRVNLLYSTKPLSLNNLYEILETSELLETYCKLFPKIKKKEVVEKIKQHLKVNFETNSLGARYVNALINRYFIMDGSLEELEAEQATFNTTLEFNK